MNLGQTGMDPNKTCRGARGQAGKRASGRQVGWQRPDGQGARGKWKSSLCNGRSEGPLSDVFYPWARWEGAWLGIESSSGSGSGSGGVWALKGPKGPNVELGGPLRAPRAQM